MGFAASALKDYADELYSFLRKRTTCSADADDVFQTIFERLVKYDRAEVVRQPHAYLFRVAVHTIREFWLRSRRDGKVVDFDSDAVERADESLDHAIEDSCERLSLERQVEKALAALPVKHRLVLLACKRDGMTYEEASRATGISASMVEKYLIEARAKIIAMAWDW